MALRNRLSNIDHGFTSLPRHVRLASTECVLIALLWCCAGCGGKSAVDAPSPGEVADINGQQQKSGARLKAIVLASDAGPTIPTKLFFDTKRQELCQFFLADDGSHRCFPVDLAWPTMSTRQFQQYADSECTQLVYLPRRASWPSFDDVTPRYAANQLETEFGTARQVYTLGPLHGGQVYLWTSDRGCMPASPGDVAYDGGTPIWNGEFASASLSVSNLRDGDLAFWQLNGDDGSGIIVGFYDLTQASGCTPSPDDAEQFCVPTNVAQKGNWPDELEFNGTPCTSSLAESSSNVEPRFMVDYSNAVYRRVVPIEDIAEPTLELSECQAAVESYRKGRLYAIGTEVALNEFPPLHQGRLKARDLALVTTESGTGALVLPRDWSYLNGVEHPDYTCELQRAADDALRCLPGRRSYDAYFADAACTSHLVTSTLTSTPRRLAVSVDDQGRGHVFAIGDSFEGDTYRRSGDGTCNRAHSEMYTLYLPLDELPPEEFARYDQATQF